ncbi:MAG: hypothetical protein AAF630_17550 [Cyanobacteria bacterium P01_C01_bin.38]
MLSSAWYLASAQTKVTNASLLRMATRGVAPGYASGFFCLMIFCK